MSELTMMFSGERVIRKSGIDGIREQSAVNALTASSELDAIQDAKGFLPRHHDMDAFIRNLAMGAPVAIILRVRTEPQIAPPII